MPRLKRFDKTQRTEDRTISRLELLTLPWEPENPEYLSSSSDSEEGDGFGPLPIATLTLCKPDDKAPKTLPPFQYVNKMTSIQKKELLEFFNITHKRDLSLAIVG
jgi:hypothetical protein